MVNIKINSLNIPSFNHTFWINAFDRRSFYTSYKSIMDSFMSFSLRLLRLKCDLNNFNDIHSDGEKSFRNPLQRMKFTHHKVIINDFIWWFCWFVDLMIFVILIIFIINDFNNVLKQYIDYIYISIFRSSSYIKIKFAIILCTVT